MNLYRNTVHGIATLVVAIVISSCTLMRPARHEPAPVVAPVVTPAPQPAPVATHRFDLPSDTDDLVGTVQVVRTSKEDTLPDIARRFDIGYEEILRANPGVDPWLPGTDKEIIVPTQFILPNAPREGVVINIAAMRIFYFPKHAAGEPQVVHTHPIGIGKVGWATPEGVTKIVRRQKDPIWHVPTSVRKEHKENGDILGAVVGPGPDNPLGRHAFYLGWPSYLIHGTNKPYGVGLRSSHGCIRLYPEDIAEFFDMIPVGTPVRVVNQPYVFGWHGGQLYFQAFNVLEDDTRDWKKAQKTLLTKSFATRLQKELKARNESVNWDAVAVLDHAPRGIPVSISEPGADIEQVLAAAPRVENRLPDGSTWDGKSDLPMDEKTFREVMSDLDPNAPAAPKGGI